jgi:hypothetical protein
MGIASVLAVILIVLKALGLVTLAWGWCLLGFGIDVLLFVGIVAAGFFFGKKTLKVAEKHFEGVFDGDAMQDRINTARDKLG